MRLSTGAGHVTAVQIDSTRPQGVSKVFEGRAPGEVVSMLGLIFSLCSTAQTMASLTAVEHAQGISVAPEQRAARDILRQAEMLSQTAMRVMMDWPRLLDLPQAATTVRAALAAQGGLEVDFFDTKPWKVLGGVNMSPNVDGVRARIQGLQSTVTQTLQEDGLAKSLLSALDAQGLNGFGALPEGVEPEVGALSRQWQNPEVIQARETYGAGLLARLLARLADLQDLPIAMLAAVEELGECVAASEFPSLDGKGTATVETARGPLTHTVELKTGQIVSYEIDAPTDLNFTNDGVVVQGLLQADADNLKTAAELHVLAVDPCVSCALEIDDA